MGSGDELVICEDCIKKDHELEECHKLIGILMTRLDVAKFAPDLLTKKIRILQQELDKRDGVEMFPDLYEDRR